MIAKIVVPTSSSLPLTAGSWPVARCGGGQRGADHARLVGEARRPYLGRRAQQRRELAEALAHGPPQNEHIRPQQSVQLRQILVHARNPSREIETFGGAHLRRGPLLRVHSAQHEVSELGIRKELPAGEERGADAGAEGEHDDRPGAALTAAEAHLGDAGRISTGLPSASVARAAPLVPIQLASTLAAVYAVPPLTTLGKATPTRPVAP